MRVKTPLSRESAVLNNSKIERPFYFRLFPQIGEQLTHPLEGVVGLVPQSQVGRRRRDLVERAERMGAADLHRGINLVEQLVVAQRAAVVGGWNEDRLADGLEPCLRPIRPRIPRHEVDELARQQPDDQSSGGSDADPAAAAGGHGHGGNGVEQGLHGARELKG